MPICSKCLRSRPAREFYRDSHSPNGRVSRCRNCSRVLNAVRRRTPRYKEVRRIRDARRRKDPAFRAKRKLYRSSQAALVRDRIRYWNRRRAHIEELKRTPKGRRRLRYLRRHRYQVSTRTNKHLADVVRGKLRRVLHGQKMRGDVVQFFGTDLAGIKAHIESKFADGMSWANWSVRGWHIDHIKPLRTFALSDPLQLRLAAHYTNLQPLWAHDNCSKGAREHFSAIGA